MKIQIRDREPFERLNPVELVAYLRTTGWREIEYQPERFSSWTRAYHGDELEVLLPLQRSLGDFALRMAETVSTLAEVEQRSQLEILEDIQLAGADVVRVRFQHAEARDGTVPLERGRALVNSACEMMLAAACSATTCRPYHASSIPEPALAFVENLRQGQSQCGSCVLTIISPVTPELRATQGRLFEKPEPPFERKAVLRLQQALLALRRTAGQATSSFRAEVFQQAVEQGVSANLCSALVDMNGTHSQPGDELRIAFTWARSRPMQSDTGREVVLPTDYFPVIAEAARMLKAVASREEQEIRGYVVKLQTIDQQGPLVGLVTVATVIDGRQRKVTIDLPEAEHQKAIDAYRNGVEIACRGILTKPGRGWTLQSPGTLTILRDERPEVGLTIFHQTGRLSAGQISLQSD